MAGSKYGDVRHATALTHAAENGHAELVPVLVKAGAKLNHVIGDGQTAVAWAARKGHTATVQALIQAGAAVDCCNALVTTTALMSAAANGHADTVLALLQAGADVNVMAPGSSNAQLGRTALACAAIGGHGAIIDLLLGKGASINLKDHNGKTALNHAIQTKCYEIADLLRERGAAQS